MLRSIGKQSGKSVESALVNMHVAVGVNMYEHGDQLTVASHEFMNMHVGVCV